MYSVDLSNLTEVEEALLAITGEPTQASTLDAASISEQLAAKTGVPSDLLFFRNSRKTFKTRFLVGVNIFSSLESRYCYSSSTGLARAFV